MESDTYVIIGGGLACRPIRKLKLFCGEQRGASGSLLLGPLTEEVPARDLKSQEKQGAFFAVNYVLLFKHTPAKLQQSNIGKAH